MVSMPSQWDLGCSDDTFEYFTIDMRCLSIHGAENDKIDMAWASEILKSQISNTIYKIEGANK